MSSSDFVIEKGVLTEYKGPGGDVTIPEGVTSIGDRAFRWCGSLTSVTLPDSVTSIGDGAFRWCGSLTSVEIPDSVTSIGDTAFDGCWSLTSVEIPDSVTSIGGLAFSSCRSLTSVTIPEGVTHIGGSAFQWCKSLTSVTIPDTMTSIGDETFCGCKSLTSVTIPDSVTSIGDWAFDGCSSLTSVTIPGSVTSIGEAAFHGCSGLADADGFVIVRNVLHSYHGSGGDVTIPAGVTSIGDAAFSGCSSLASVTIPRSVTSIGGSAFRGCSKLRSVTIPESVTSIGNLTFCDCSSLTSVTIPDSVTSIGNEAFRGCSSLTSVTIPDSVTSIGDRAFEDCKSLASVTIPEGVTSIGGWAFSGCRSMRSVTIPDGVTSIGSGAFYFCERLTSVTIPESVTSIGNEAFRGCKSLASVEIPESVTSIGDSAFSGCSSLASVEIPESVTSIGDSAFSGCSSLASVEIPESMTSIGESVFAGCGQLQKLDVGQKLKSLGRDPFGGAIPEKLLGRLSGLLQALTDASIKNYLLERNGQRPPLWEKLPVEDKLQIYLTRQGKSLLGAYPAVVSADTAQAIREALVARMTGKASLKDCNTAANFLTTLYEKIPAEGMKELFALLQKEKNGAKAVKLVEGHVPAMEKLGSAVEVDRSLSPAMQKVMETLIAEKKNFKDLEQDLKKMYSMTMKDLPKLLSAEGAEEDPLVLGWLLTAHETMERGHWDQSVVAAEYKSPGLCPEAEQVVALLDPKSLQEAVRALADTHLVAYQNAKKKFLAYPICRYADEANMAELTKRAPKWATSVSGNDAPPLLQLRDAVKYSNTRAAMLFAERYGELDDYAKLRGMTEDELRDKYLSDVGLDEQGGKVYDLGSQTVTARLQKDLSFLFELPGGKTAKSLPKKGADPAKYEAAKADFDEMRKAVKKILKSRGAVLFGDFLSGRERESNPWQEAYLKNPLLRMAAGLVVWDQGGKSFTLTDAGAIDADGQPYTVGETPIKLAHPMEMDADTVQAWQRYFNARGLKQPFAQVWEPAIDPKTVREDRYKDCLIPYYRFTGQAKHGINVEDWDFHNEISISFKGCDATVERIDWERHEIDPNHRFEVTSFKFKKYDRQVNHIVGYLDRVTVWDRVRKDDVTVMEWMERFTLAQIAEFIAAAQEAGAVNVLALLLEYKNAHFADFDPMDEFTLEW